MGQYIFEVICESSPLPRAQIHYAGILSQPPRAPTAGPKGVELPGLDFNHMITAPRIRSLYRQGVEHVVRYDPGW
eukprot:2873457-Pleurochrysis_carterae.AAC.1